MSELPTSGEWVRYLQELLERAGYWDDVRTEEVNPSLRSAIARFQSDHAISATGMPEGPTWLALAESAGDERVAEIDWESDFPELYRVAEARDLDDYLRRVAEIDPADFRDESVEAEEQPPGEATSPESEEEAE